MRSESGIPRRQFLVATLRSGARDATYEVEIVLDDVPLERLQRQRSVAHGHDERMVDKLLPHVLDVWPLEKVLEEVAPVSCQDAGWMLRRRHLR